MSRTAYIFVPGVLNYPGNATEWTDKAATWINTRMAGAAAEKFEYLALPFSRRLMAQRRAEQLAALIDRYPVASFSMVLSGHSNGCDLIARALWIAKRPANFVHLFAPAVSIAPERNRLRRLVSSGRIGFLNLYISGRDRVLNRHHLGGVAAGRVLEQFRDEHHTTVDFEPAFGHCTWWTAAQFESSMNRIAGVG